jgi:hypothetical protein
MKVVPLPWRLGSALGLGAVAFCFSLAGASSASSRASTAASGPQKTVKASVIKRRKGTLARGSAVSSHALGQRVFTTDTNGFALASVGDAQYPAATFDGGAHWKTYGPALHVNAAQAPLAVSSIGAVNRRLVYAFGGGSVIDATNNGGKSWYGALFNGEVMAVVHPIRGRLVAFIDGSSGKKGVTWQYVSRDGGRTWHFNSHVGGF